MVLNHARLPDSATAAGGRSLAVRTAEEDANRCSPVHSRETILRALALVRKGHTPSEIARALGVARASVRSWASGDLPRSVTQPTGPPDPDRLPAEYVYLLGLYLGDGCLSCTRKGVFKLRVFLDAKYPGIIGECQHAIGAVRPGATVGIAIRPGNGAVEVYSYWKAWAALFPQHGPGKKHHRSIVLASWQERLVDRNPGLLLRGLIHSDGCRFMNTGSKGWRNPRYSFSNRSADIHGIFCAACDRLGLRWTTAPHTVYVSRKEDVERLDRLVGPKA